MSGGGGGRRSRDDSRDREHEHGRRQRRRDSDGGGGGGSAIPEVNSIFQGTVVSIMDYGAFIRIPGCIKNGLVHKSQLSKCRVDHVNEVVSLNDRVWCKVISLGEDSNKISLSMKAVNQGSGQDLDPNGVQAGLDENRRKTYTPFSQPKITLEAVLNTVCKKCNTKGHLAQNCFQSSSGKSYQLIDDDDDSNDERHGSPPAADGDAVATVDTLKKEHKKHKEKKHKKRKAAKKSRAHKSDDDSDDDTPAKRKEADKVKEKKKRKRERQSSSSASSSSSPSSGAAQKSSKRVKEKER